MIPEISELKPRRLELHVLLAKWVFVSLVWFVCACGGGMGFVFIVV